jgi:hypothetical protein
VPQRRRRNRLGTSTATGLPKAGAPNKVWAVDFQFDATTEGRLVTVTSTVPVPAERATAVSTNDVPAHGDAATADT